MKAPVLAFVVALTLRGQGTSPRTGPSEYPVHAQIEKGYALAAEYLLHALPTMQGNLIATDYLIVEVAFFGPPLTPLEITSGQFELRMNGRKIPILSEQAGMVAASIKYPDWTQKPGLTGAAGVGPVIIGPRTPAPHFPGDPTVRKPPTPEIPQPGDDIGLERDPPMSIDDRIQLSALPEGNRQMPVAGLLFFPFQGKTKSIRTLELVYEGPGGKVTLKLL
jgi:hypothetical protein